jgi:signal transduction histidine kinase
MEPVDLSALLSNTFDLIRRDPIFTAIDVRIDGASFIVQADAAQLQLVFQNVLINAAQAMNGQGPVTVTIAGADGQCRVSIADAGPGMPPDVREHAFEPFFDEEPRHRPRSGVRQADRRRPRRRDQIDTPSTGGTSSRCCYQSPGEPPIACRFTRHAKC